MFDERDIQMFKWAVIGVISIASIYYGSEVLVRWMHR